MKDIVKQKGFSLIQVIMAIGATSLIALAMMKNSQTISSSNSAVVSAADFKTLTNTFHTKFLDLNYCASSLGGRMYPLNLSADEVPTALDELNRPTYDDNGSIVLHSRNTVSIPRPIRELKIPPSTAPPLQFGTVNLIGMQIVRPPLGQPGLFLDFMFQRDNLKSFGGKDLTKRIPIIATFDGSGTVIQSCYSDKNNQISDNLPIVVNELKNMKKQVYQDANGYLKSSGGSLAGSLFSN